MLTDRERIAYRQIHPAKLLTGWVAALASLYPLWHHEFAVAVAVMFVPPLFVSTIALRYVDLRPLTRSGFGRYAIRHMSLGAIATRISGTVVMAVGAWYHWLAAIAIGVIAVVLSWLYGLIKRRAAPIRADGGATNWFLFALQLLRDPQETLERVRRWRRLPDLPSEDLLAAACTVYEWEAAQFLRVYQPGRMNGVPAGDWFRRHFSFSQADLVDFIEREPQQVRILISRAEDQRRIPAVVFKKIGSEFEVGIYDKGGYGRARRYGDGARAAADFVLAHWGMPRLDDEPALGGYKA